MSWYESLPALGIITAAVAAMGGLQSLVHWGAYGKPKAVGLGQWDYRLRERDERLHQGGETE
uniref:NADH dehydrogenase [ubiquinone] 1 alpha subcomplex subunit 1 n=1 Tax=Tetraselmis sp. GSL018 TaxID=582737 RepID=A0A061R431_9CHLO